MRIKFTKMNWRVAFVIEIKRKVKKMKKNKNIDKETRLKNIENAVREI